MGINKFSKGTYTFQRVIFCFYIHFLLNNVINLNLTFIFVYISYACLTINFIRSQKYMQNTYICMIFSVIMEYITKIYDYIYLKYVCID